MLLAAAAATAAAAAAAVVAMAAEAFQKQLVNLMIYLSFSTFPHGFTPNVLVFERK